MLARRRLLWVPSHARPHPYLCARRFDLSDDDMPDDVRQALKKLLVFWGWPT